MDHRIKLLFTLGLFISLFGCVDRHDVDIYEKYNISSIIQNGDARKLFDLIDNNSDVHVDLQDGGGNTLLHNAVLLTKHNVIRMLISKGANPNIKDNSTETPLMSAVRNGDKIATRILLENGADPNTSDDDFDNVSPLMEVSSASHDFKNASREDKLYIAKLLLQHGATVNSRSDDGITPLFMACFYMQENLARLLIKKGANVNYGHNNGVLPIHVAAGKNPYGISLELLRLLIENGANPKAVTKKGETPIGIASKGSYNSKSAIELLSSYQ